MLPKDDNKAIQQHNRCMLRQCPWATIDDLLEILARVEAQNAQILSCLAPRPTQKNLNVNQAAQRLDRTSWTIRRLCNTGQIHAIKGEDGRWRVPAAEITRLEEEGVPKLPKR